MGIKFIIKDGPQNKKFFDQINKIGRSTDEGIRKAFFTVGTLLRKEARRSIIQGPKTGRLYRIKGRRHRASAPGEPPANFTGTLQKSVGFKTHGKRELEFGARAPYAAFLELGTSKMQKRPYLIRSINNLSKNITVTLEDKIEKEIKK